MNKRIISLVIGIVCIVIGIFIMVTHFTNKAKQTAETTATIVRVDSEVETDTDGLETRYYYPVIEYAVDEKKYENRLPDSGSSNSTEYKIGDSVTISYNPENPNELSKKGSIGGIIGGVFFIVFGIIAIISILKM